MRFGQYIRAWEVVSGENSVKFTAHNLVDCVTYNRDGKTLISLTSHDIRLWDAESWKNTATLPILGAECLASNRDNKTVATGLIDGTVKIWDLASGKNIAIFKGHTGSVISVEFSPDGKTLASASSDRTIKLWELATGENTATAKGENGIFSSVTFSPDGETLASGNSTTAQFPFGMSGQKMNGRRRKGEGDSGGYPILF